MLRKHGKCIAWEFIPSGLVDNHFIWDLGKRPAQKPNIHSPPWYKTFSLYSFKFSYPIMFRTYPYLHRYSNGNSAGCCYWNWLLSWFVAHYHSVQALQVQEKLTSHFQHYCYELNLHPQCLQ
jgi:hypothetical protein